MMALAGEARVNDGTIRVLHVIGSLGVGGAEKQLLELCKRMDGRNFDATVLYYSPTPDTLESEYRKAGIRVVSMDKFAVPAWKFFGQLRATIRRANPDIVHTWLSSANFWGRWAAVSLGIRTLVSSDRSELAPLHPVQRLTERLLRGRTIRLANSKAVRDSLNRHAGIPESYVRIIHNGVELPQGDRDIARRDVRAELGIPSDEAIVLMVGRAVPPKNYPLFVRVGAAIARERERVTFVAVGRMFQDAHLPELVEELGAAGHVRLLDQRPDVLRLMKAADVFCLTSNHEGMPNVVLEAMAAGVPVVCTAFAAATEVIDAPNSGVLVPRNDEAALRAALLGLLDNPERRQTLGAAGRERVKAKFSYPRLVTEMEKLYTDAYLKTSHRKL